MPKEILFYSRGTDYAFLSNFYRCKIMLDGFDWSTVEHYYQASKTRDPTERELIRTAPTPADAKRLGRTSKLVSDWEDIKLNVMRKALRAKFIQNIDLGVRLLGTGDAVLHEDSPRDMIWGIHGQDLLGKMLMEIRSEIGDELAKVL